MTTCSETGCDRAVNCRGLCARHYHMRWKAENPDKVARYAPRSPCRVPGCTQTTTQTWCRSCAPKMQRKRQKQTPWKWEKLEGNSWARYSGEQTVTVRQLSDGRFFWQAAGRSGHCKSVDSAKRYTFKVVP